MKFKWISSSALFSSVFLTFGANAAVTCEGKVTEVQTLSSGIVRLVSDSGVPMRAYLCNINGNWGNISSDTCKAWVSSAHVALTTSKPIVITYDNATSSCERLPVNSSSLFPSLVSLKL